MTTTFPPPPAVGNGGSTPALIAQQLPPPYYPGAPSSSTASSIVIVIIIIASAVIVSASIYILLRFLSRRYHRAFRTADEDVIVLRPETSRRFQAAAGLLDDLPLFTFRSVHGDLAGADCAVCLSKFEPHDQLRLLPLCCHAFHAACIDTWIVANHTCPLCRSAVLPPADLLAKTAPAAGGGGSFRVEIGSVSRRGAADDGRRSYSIGSFDYVLDENGYEVPVGSTAIHRRGGSDCTSVDKESSVGIQMPEPPGEAIAAEVSGGRNWLREYMDRLASSSSRALSFRSSGRFFTGSSRRSDLGVEDLEANQHHHRVGEEISELFRWLSGI
ncbi:E3 ubiquitin-protein ligase ATL4 [Striga hermonthica]|uniref:E3 ubiquitin-protein ligase ATL4 n=1 Tax=Striga hermonthica TaxID=68872 RepID=A0A9N7N2P8_STRHE|nr:E3 ubiquitin-protein ligase ATL4 [Striga hermonthica]